MRRFFLFSLLIPLSSIYAQNLPHIEYTISIPQPSSHQYHVELKTFGWNIDTLILKMPKWMPGYYQIMNYAKSVDNIQLKDEKGKVLSFLKLSDNTIRINGIKNKTLILTYDVMTSRQFVAISYVDVERAYLIPENTFFYVDGFIKLPVQVQVDPKPWSKVATGLESSSVKANLFTASDFDILYDCPILIGDLEELPSFQVRGIDHRFIGYKLGDFNKVDFAEKLRKLTEAGVNVIGDIPYNQYTYIAIGPGRGGIEHLNNTTVSFDGSSLNNDAAMNRMMNFLAHEYFHHYNVKRIRPFELGPFDYEAGSRTNLLWVSEGISVYYEYLIVRRAGLADEQTLFRNFEANINAHENNSGKEFQSLIQSSYNTWKDGPFGTQGDEAGKAISYYDKGPIVGLLLDLAIRQSTNNNKSLDDVMRQLYWKYYKGKGRGFTDAEFGQTCEEIAGASLREVFEYVYTTRQLDYNKYLGYAGLKLVESTNPNADQNQKKKFTLEHLDNPNALQRSILNSWQGEK